MRRRLENFRIFVTEVVETFARLHTPSTACYGVSESLSFSLGVAGKQELFCHINRVDAMAIYVSTFNPHREYAGRQDLLG